MNPTQDEIPEPVGSMYAAVPALVLNLALAAVLTPLLCGIPKRDTTDRNAYIG